jgi:hypothetical protein
MSDRARRLAVIVLLASVAWFAVVLLWATRGTEDAVPLGNQPGWESLPLDPSTSVAPAPISAGPVVVRDVACGGVLDGEARSGTLPPLPFPQVYNREPCELQHSDGRLVFVFDSVVFAAVVGGAIAVLVRTARRPHLPDDAAAAA